MTLIEKLAWTIISKLSAPFTATKYNIGERVEVEGQVYLVRRIVEPEPDWWLKEPMVEIQLVGDDGIQQHRMSERVLDERRTGKIGASAVDTPTEDGQ